MNRLILSLVPVWLVAAVAGALVDGLFWLTVVAVVLFVASLGTLSSRLRRRRTVIGPVRHHRSVEPVPAAETRAPEPARS